MKIRNAFDFLRKDEIKNNNLIECFIIRLNKFQNYMNNEHNLQDTINNCINNLDDIKLKIYNQQDRSAYTI